MKENQMFFTAFLLVVSKLNINCSPRSKLLLAIRTLIFAFRCRQTVTAEHMPTVNERVARALLARRAHSRASLRPRLAFTQRAEIHVGDCDALVDQELDELLALARIRVEIVNESLFGRNRVAGILLIPQQPNALSKSEVGSEKRAYPRCAFFPCCFRRRRHWGHCGHRYYALKTQWTGYLFTTKVHLIIRRFVLCNSSQSRLFLLLWNNTCAPIQFLLECHYYYYCYCCYCLLIAGSEPSRGPRRECSMSIVQIAQTRIVLPILLESFACCPLVVHERLVVVPSEEGKKNAQMLFFNSLCKSIMYSRWLFDPISSGICSAHRSSRPKGR